MSEKPRFTTRLQWVNPHTGQMTSEAQRILSALIEGLWTRSGLLTSSLITGTAGSANTLAKWNADGDLVTAGNSAAAAGGFYTGGGSVADDAVLNCGDITPNNNDLMWLWNLNASGVATAVMGKVRGGASPTNAAILGSTTNIDRVTTDVTGTTGVDGNITIASIDGAVKIENRSGATMSFSWLMMRRT